MSFPPVSGRRRRSRDWLQMDDTIPTSDWLPVTMPVLVDGEIYLVDAELPIIPDDDRRRLDEIRDEVRRQREDLDMVLYGLNRKRARAPASSDDAIQGLLQEARAGDAGMLEECAVCLQDFDADAKETLRVMPCSHAFHPDCIFSWLRVKAVCPLCRHALPTQQHEDPDFEDEDDSDEDDSDSDEDDAVNHQEESTPAVTDPEEP
ncbi:unnamed protein product [Miscanthus lutarioriparius]|uniref:RING-type E3 ubiquitin transferase n=1 Tax=Miscanthus lutarioriparius TaxID=422564 RepID=A0A811QDK9_9POAL|nr:unnamed protein product [Miscanthus lutarioriparius]